MRKLYYEYFYVPKDGEGKISEKALLTRITATVLLVILCLAQMSFAALAHFLGKRETKKDPILMAAHYDMKVKVTVDGHSSFVKKIVATELDTFPKTYEVTLSLGEENTAATGFCIVYVDYPSTVVVDPIEEKEHVRDDASVITVENEDETLRYEEVLPQPPDVIYHTQQVGKDVNAKDGERKTLTFKIVLNGPATVRLIPNWGTSVNYDYDNDNSELYVENGDVLKPQPLPFGDTVIERPKEKENTEETGAFTDTKAPETTSSPSDD